MRLCLLEVVVVKKMGSAYVPMYQGLIRIVEAYS